MSENQSSRARALFEQFTSSGAAALLQGMPAEVPKRFEDENLDFKHGRPQDADLDIIWSKALCSFANNSGGVLVFGIIADRDKGDETDCVKSVSLVPDLTTLKNKLKMKLSTLTDPPLKGVEIQSVPLVQGGNEGFIVCFIPASEDKPYECKARGIGYPYYIRIGDSSVQMPRTLLKQAFNPAHITKASIRIKFEKMEFRQERYAKFTFVISNTGLQSIESGYVAVRCNDAELFRLIHTLNPLESMTMVEENRYFYTGEIIHPEMHTESMVFHAKRRQYAGIGKMEFHLYQRNQAAKYAECLFDFSRFEFHHLTDVLPETITLNFEEVS